MKAIKIDVDNKTVYEVEVNGLSDIQRQVGGLITSPVVEADYFKKDCLYVDDEGLLKPVKGYFLIEGAYQPFAGNGIIVGLNEEGESIDCFVKLDRIKSAVRFVDPEDIYNEIRGIEKEVKYEEGTY